eukprot:4641760-Prymnesium_polylepis.1
MGIGIAMAPRAPGGSSRRWHARSHQADSAAGGERAVSAAECARVRLHEGCWVVQPWPCLWATVAGVRWARANAWRS